MEFKDLDLLLLRPRKKNYRLRNWISASNSLECSLVAFIFIMSKPSETKSSSNLTAIIGLKALLEDLSTQWHLNDDNNLQADSSKGVDSTSMLKSHNRSNRNVRCTNLYYSLQICIRLVLSILIKPAKTFWDWLLQCEQIAHNSKAKSLGMSPRLGPVQSQHSENTWCT